MSLFEIIATIGLSCIAIGIIMIIILFLTKSSKSVDSMVLLRISEMLHNSDKEFSMDLHDFETKILSASSTNTLEKNVIEIVNKSIKEETANFMKFESKILNSLDFRLNSIEAKVNIRLDDGFKKTNETFQHIVERISRIDEAQKKIEQLSTNIVSLQDILSDKKSRGTFGEIELKQLLTAVFGEGNRKIFELQRTLSNGFIADSVLYCPEPLGMICIDSKFPLENYRRMVDSTITDASRIEASKAFKNDVKKHIDDIHNKYIIKNETSDQAVLFLPSEAIFAELNAYHQDVIEYSYKKSVWLTSPTTLMAFLTTIQVMFRNIERNKYTRVIQEELEKLAIEFSRYRIRWDKLKRDIDSVSKDVSDIHTTTDKITTKFEKISAADLTEDSPKVTMNP